MDYINSIASLDHAIDVADIHTRNNGDHGQTTALVINLHNPIPVLKDDCFQEASTIVVETRYIHMLGPNLKGAIYRFFRKYASIGVSVTSNDDGSFTEVNLFNGFFPCKQDERIIINAPCKVYKSHSRSLIGLDITEASVTFGSGYVSINRNSVPQTLSDEELIRIACLVTQ